MLAHCAHTGTRTGGDPIAEEALRTAVLVALMRAMHTLGEERLLYAATPWPRLIAAGYAPGALTPDAARSLTRRSRQTAWQHRVDLRAQRQRRASLTRWGFA